MMIRRDCKGSWRRNCRPRKEDSRDRESSESTFGGGWTDMYGKELPRRERGVRGSERGGCASGWALETNATLDFDW